MQTFTYYQQMALKQIFYERPNGVKSCIALTNNGITVASYNIPTLNIGVVCYILHLIQPKIFHYLSSFTFRICLIKLEPYKESEPIFLNFNSVKIFFIIKVKRRCLDCKSKQFRKKRKIATVKNFLD